MYSNHQKDPKDSTAYRHVSRIWHVFLGGLLYGWVIIAHDWIRLPEGSSLFNETQIWSVVIWTWPEHHKIQRIIMVHHHVHSYFTVISGIFPCHFHAMSIHFHSIPFPFFTEVVAAPGRKGSSEPWHLHHRSCACPTKAPLGDGLPWGCGGFDKVEPIWQK